MYRHIFQGLALTTIGILYVGTVSAQNVTIDKESAPVRYYRMPDKPLDPSFTTYSRDIVAYGGDLIKSGMTQSALEDEYLELQGYEDVTQHGDVHIEATVSNFTVFSERRDSRQKKSKDKDGKEVVTTVYWMEVKYALPISLTVTDRKGRVLDDRFIFTLTDQRTYSTPTHKSISDLDSYWRSNRVRQLSDLHKTMLTDGFKKIYDAINYTFGYMRITNEHARFETIGKKKHLEYEKYQNAVETIKRGFELMDPDKSLDPVKKAIAPALTFYQDQEKVYPERDKELSKIKHICLYNLALAYFWVEEFDKATQFAQATLRLDEKDRDTKRLLEEIEEVKASLTRADKPSRHQVKIGRT